MSIPAGWQLSVVLDWKSSGRLNPDGREIFSFHPFVYLGDLEAVSTCCWQTVSTSEVFSLLSPVLHLFCCTVKQLIIKYLKAVQVQNQYYTDIYT